MADITIVKKLKDQNDPGKGHKLEPETGKRTTVKAGDNVTFRRGQGVLALSIEFSEKSPFGADKKTVDYDTPIPVTVAVDPDPQRNLYKYSCRASGLSTDDGGEMEIIR